MDTVHECDRQTDRITITKTVQTASHGKNADDDDDDDNGVPSGRYAFTGRYSLMNILAAS